MAQRPEPLLPLGLRLGDRRVVVVAALCTLVAACSEGWGSGAGCSRRSAGSVGTGVEACSEAIDVEVPAGVADGERLRVPGKGHAGTRGAAPGDLYVTVQVEPHPLFRREGDDLYLTVPVAIHEAALGARFDIPTLDGPTRLRVPPGTTPPPG